MPYIKILHFLFVLLLLSASAEAQVPNLPPRPKPKPKPVPASIPAPKPKVKVVVVNQDRDGDGLIDEKDICPTEAGPPSNNGCPLPVVTHETAGTRKSFEPEMVLVPGGTFLMGSASGESDEKPEHRVTVSPFYMGKYEVTVREFAAFVQATNYRTDAEKEGDSYVLKGTWKKQEGVSWRDDEQGNRRLESDWNKPVIYVSWNDAVAYCSWLKDQTGKAYRLPTEAEWEYAAGNGARHTTYSWGDSEPSASNVVGNVDGMDDGYTYAAAVNAFRPNAFGLYNMSGNVWEWCQDWYDGDYYSRSTERDPPGPSSGNSRVLRGGSWRNYLSSTRVAYRYGDSPTDRDGNFGFRVVFPG